MRRRSTLRLMVKIRRRLRPALEFIAFAAAITLAAIDVLRGRWPRPARRGPAREPAEEIELGVRLAPYPLND